MHEFHGEEDTPIVDWCSLLGELIGDKMNSDVDIMDKHEFRSIVQTILETSKYKIRKNCMSCDKTHNSKVGKFSFF